MANILQEKPERPKVLPGLIIKVRTGCGNMYVQMSWYHGSLFEIFATHGHSGGCAISGSEAVTRSVTLGLKRGLPIEDYIKQLRGIRCPSPYPFPKEESNLSCYDAMATLLKTYGTLSTDGIVKIFYDTNDILGSASELELAPGEKMKRAKEAIDNLRKIREEQGVNE
jgi:hypothetical protein